MLVCQTNVHAAEVSPLFWKKKIEDDVKWWFRAKCSANWIFSALKVCYAGSFKAIMCQVLKGSDAAFILHSRCSIKIKSVWTFSNGGSTF